MCQLVVKSGRESEIMPGEPTFANYPVDEMIKQELTDTKTCQTA
jgi:hypothetical protein